MKNSEIEKKCQAIIDNWMDLLRELGGKHTLVDFSMELGSFIPNRRIATFFCPVGSLTREGTCQVDGTPEIIEELQHLIGESEYKRGDLIRTPGDGVYMLTQDKAERALGLCLEDSPFNGYSKGGHGRVCNTYEKHTDELVIEQLDDGKEPKQGDLVIYKDGEIVMVVNWDGGCSFSSYEGVVVRGGEVERGDYDDCWSKTRWGAKKLHGKITLTKDGCKVEEYGKPRINKHDADTDITFNWSGGRVFYFEPEKPTIESLEKRIKQLEADNQKLREGGCIND